MLYPASFTATHPPPSDARRLRRRAFLLRGARTHANALFTDAAQNRIDGLWPAWYTLPFIRLPSGEPHLRQRASASWSQWPETIKIKTASRTT